MIGLLLLTLTITIWFWDRISNQTVDLHSAQRKLNARDIDLAEMSSYFNLFVEIWIRDMTTATILITQIITQSSRVHIQPVKAINTSNRAYMVWLSWIAVTIVIGTSNSVRPTQESWVPSMSNPALSFALNVSVYKVSTVLSVSGHLRFHCLFPWYFFSYLMFINKKT